MIVRYEFVGYFNILKNLIIILNIVDYFIKYIFIIIFFL